MDAYALSMNFSAKNHPRCNAGKRFLPFIHYLLWATL